ncbi:GGDEF domain-containing protein [Massilia alkalitolerans]|jgi:diguanylate cyclase (GGDEF)-like protein|uniref:GGDEF domain-containing protein n=1 Tax=Massilia alkalitolerans TaxID=286638 RepID=UPI000482CD58|nr:GGDEF domain-containing protein [Massilia alkalitolerans]
MSARDSFVLNLAQVSTLARTSFIALLLVTMALLCWQHYGMERVVDIIDPHFELYAEDDRISSGKSEASIERNGGHALFRCRIVKVADWPYCKLNVILERSVSQGIDMTRISHITLDIAYQGAGPARLGMMLVNSEEGFTVSSQWQTYKINQVDAIDIPANESLFVPTSWFVVAQWWKELAKPPLEHSSTRIDNIVRLELSTPAGVAAGEHLYDIRAIRLHGKMISQNTLLIGLVVMWILFAVSWPLAAAMTLRKQLRESDAALKQLGEINRALELEAQELASQAHIDPLTGVLNRQGLRAVLISTSTLMADPMSVIFIDIDHFKMINDRHGHDVGDEVLRKFAQVVRSGVRSSDQLVRWGGEEFLIICPMTRGDQAKLVAESLREALHRQDWPAGLAVTASFGVAQHCNGDEIGIVIKHADRELYNAKASGRDRVHAFDGERASAH